MSHLTSAFAVLANLNLTAATFYVSLDSPNPSPPYATWATAAHVIQDAVDAASPGDEVVVTNGVYRVGTVETNGLNRVAMTKPVTLRSVNGPHVTVIEGATNGVRCAYVGSGAVLSGFTLTKGVVHEAPLRAPGSGGGVLSEPVWSEKPGVVTNCVITGNSAGCGGGARGGILYSCFLTRNSATECGGGAHEATLYNCVVSGNSARYGGGVADGGLHNCTVTENIAHHGGGVARLDPASGCHLWNCITYHNRASDAGSANYGLKCSFEYSCTSPLPDWGSGNIDADPQLITASHIASGSPCVGAGNPTDVSGVDIDGEPWGMRPAMGADQPGWTIGPLTLWIEAELAHVGTGYPVKFGALNSGPIQRAVWDFDDGTMLANRPWAGHAWDGPGQYTVRLTGYNESYPQGVTATATITVTEAVAYVDVASATPVFPYSSWDTAATNLQDAIGASTLPGQLVLVTDGVYRTGTTENNGLNRVALTNQVVVRSVNGPEVTVVEGAANGVRCAYIGNGSVLSGFTLTKGTTATSEHWPESSGGGAWCEPWGLLTNCVLTANSAYSEGGGIYGGTISNSILNSNSADNGGGGAARSTLDNCRLTGNSAWEGGGACESTLIRCLVAGNSADAGGGTSRCTLHNCTLTTNSAEVKGGGVYQSTLSNCLLIGNSARYGGGAWNPQVRGGTLYHCTVAENHAAERGGGVGWGGVENCIVLLNQAPSGSNYYNGPLGLDAAEWVISHCCTSLLPTNGLGNIDADPRFVAAAAGDYRLRPDSPCIDAGTNLTEVITTDLLGLPRPLDGDGDGVARHDMGAYEFNPYRFGPVLRPDSTGFSFAVHGEAGRSVRIERSRDLMSWERVATVPIPATGQTLIDPAAASESRLFYRAVSMP